MSLSLKAELEIWAAALKAYDEQDFGLALDQFSRIADSSKILTNIGLIYATIGEHQTAVDHFVAATNLDSYLAIAHFQCGVSNFLLQRYDLALLNFEDAHLYLRGNEAINYDQLGLKFKLFSAEIMFNKGLAQLNLGYSEQGLADMQEASKLKVTNEHGVIDEAVRDHGQGYTVFSIPVGVLYRPSENKLKNSKSKDYLGKAKLVAASDSNDAFTEFTGVVKRQQASADSENKNTPGTEPSALDRSITLPPPRIDPLAPRPSALDRSRTALQLGPSGLRPDPAAILASRRSQSVSNPTNVAPPPSGLSRSKTTQGRSSTTRLARNGTANAGVMPLRVKTPQDARVGGDSGPALPTLRNQPSHRRLKSHPVAPESVPPPQVQPAQYMNAPSQDMRPLPSSVQEGHLTQFYNAFMDAYTDDQVSRLAFPRPPTTQPSSNAPLYQGQSPAPLTFYQQPQPLSQEQQQLPAWMQAAPSPVRTSNNTSASSGTSRAPSRAANAGMGMGMNMEPVVGMNQNINKGGVNNVGGRRKVTRRPTGRRVTVYKEEDGDDGFVTGEYDEIELANIRIKLHYQGDVRGMTMPSMTTFDEFVERVTAKFGTARTGLGMKFTDEDGTKISLRDESDFELAIETAREGAKGRSEGKIEVWCVDV